MRSRNDAVKPEIKKADTIKAEKVDETIPVEKKKKIKIGDSVKIKEGIQNDMLGRRIHPGIRNYNYVVKLVRVDGYLVIECLTYQFVLREDEVELVK